jgi:mannose-1-phosphate guanylyltransferase
LPESARSSRDPDPHLYITILAGGIGSRFWPASTPSRPKQLLPLASPNPLIVDTFTRAQKVVSDDRIHILTGSKLAKALPAALPDLSEAGLMIEPQARGTAPVLTWAAWEISKRDPDAVLISLHADHMIRLESAFVDLLHETAGLARREKLLFTVAVPPTRPETGYGYIEPGEPIPDSARVRAFGVVSFREKPDAGTAESYVAAGHLWNSGIFVWKASTFLEELKEVTPELADLLPFLEEGRVDEFFARAPVTTVDVAVLERSGRVASVAATFEWDDVGSWEALMRSQETDDDGNVLIGNGHLVESSRNVVYSPEGTVVAYGVEDLVIVQSGEVTLVTRRELAPSLKDLLDQLPPELQAGESLVGGGGLGEGAASDSVDQPEGSPSPEEED